MDWTKILNGAKMIRNYRMSSQPRKDRRIARLWLEKPVLKTANLLPGTGLIVKVTSTTYNQEDGEYEWPVVHIRAAIALEKPTHCISERKAKGDPILDICNEEIDKALGIGKIDIVVKESGEIFVYRELTFQMIPRLHQKAKEYPKYRVLSLFAGAGGMTSGFVNQGCESVMAVDIDDPEKNPLHYEQQSKEPSYSAWTIETLQKNFPNSLVYWGDLRSLHNMYVKEADIVCVSPPCVEFSRLGARMEGLVEHFAFHIVRIILASKARVIFFENVDAFYESETYQNIKRMLIPYFPHFYEETLDSYDFGTLDTRRRGYVVAWREQMSFKMPDPREFSVLKRKKVVDYLHSVEDRKWQPIQGTTMGTFFGKHSEKYSHTGFTADKNRTLVHLGDTKIACITKGYNKIQSSQSYIKHESEEKWSLFTPEELKDILQYPSWFRMADGIPNTRYYEILGNSVNVRVIELIASSIVNTLKWLDKNTKVAMESIGLTLQKNGQYSLVL